MHQACQLGGRFCAEIAGVSAQLLRLGRGGAAGALRLHLKRPDVAHGVARTWLVVGFALSAF